MVTSTRIIVLNLTKIGERSVVLHTLSPEFGRRSFITNIGGKTGTALFLPLNVLDCEVTGNPKSDLWRVSRISVCHPLNSLRSNRYKNTMALFMSEVLFRAIHEGNCEEGLFEWCEKSILTLDGLQNDFSNYHLRFLLELAAAMGFSPNVEGLMPFAGKHLSSLQELLSLDFSHCMLLPMNGEQRNEIAGILLEYLSCHTESRIEARSLKVLREIYA